MKKLILFLCISLVATASYAQEEDENGYDSLVNQLSRRYERDESRDLLSNVRFHLGVGIASSVFSVALPNGKTTYASQRGVEADFGIDLFSPNWLAEGSILNYGERDYDKAKLSLREFDLKIAWLGRLDRSFSLKLGGGLAARYLKANYLTSTKVTTSEGTFIQDEWREDSYTTPSSVIFAGLVSRLTDSFSIGGEIASRSSLTGETPDQSSLDFSVRVDGHF